MNSRLRLDSACVEKSVPILGHPELYKMIPRHNKVKITHKLRACASA
jgi:hypothetical protein